MKARNGGLGMTDAEVEGFVARYMPGYECFGGIDFAHWKSRALQMVIDASRRVIETKLI